MRIKVTHQDIRDGITGDCSLCPVIRAIRRETGYPRAKLETSDLVWLNHYPVWLPMEEVLRIQTFDRTGEMMPHEFELCVHA